MKIIMLQDVPKIGRKYEVKEINDGYARNFLIPKKLAEIATPSTIAELKKREEKIRLERSMKEEAVVKNLSLVKDVVLEIKAKVNEKGHLFQGIGKKEIAEAIKKAKGAELIEEFIALDKSIKEVGEFDIPVKVILPSGKILQASFKLKVTKE